MTTWNHIPEEIRSKIMYSGRVTHPISEVIKEIKQSQITFFEEKDDAIEEMMEIDIDLNNFDSYFFYMVWCAGEHWDWDCFDFPNIFLSWNRLHGKSLLLHRHYIRRCYPTVSTIVIHPTSKLIKNERRSYEDYLKTTESYADGYIIGHIEEISFDFSMWIIE